MQIYIFFNVKTTKKPYPGDVGTSRYQFVVIGIVYSKLNAVFVYNESTDLSRNGILNDAKRNAVKVTIFIGGKFNGKSNVYLPYLG